MYGIMMSLLRAGSEVLCGKNYDKTCIIAFRIIAPAYIYYIYEYLTLP